ncbi:MAG: type II toxin-antitoxin system PemK/MazF family toxin [Ilumatobacteraceae bacterium]
MTTIKVADSTRDRVNELGARARQTADQVVSRALEEYERSSGKSSPPRPMPSPATPRRPRPRRPRRGRGTRSPHATPPDVAERPRRGEVWLADLGEPIGHEAAFLRPVLVVSDDPANGHGLVVVCPITGAKHGYPTRIEIVEETSGLDQTSYVQGEQVRTISAGRLVHPLGTAGIVVMHAVERVLRLLLRL